MIGSLIRDHYRTAKQSLENSRTRTLLTISGVAIGVASITTILSLSGGVGKLVSQQVETIGDNLAVVRPFSQRSGLADLNNPLSRNQFTTSPITEDDLETVYSVKGTQDAAPLMTLSANIRTRTSQPQYSTLVATTPALEDINKLELSDGQFIDSVTLENTVVIGAQLSVDLYGTEQAIGKTLLIRGQTFTVIGVLKRTNAPVNFNAIDFDSAAFVGLKTGKLFNGGVAQIQQINILTEPGTNMRSYTAKVEREISRRHDNQKDVVVLYGKNIAQPTSELFNLISLSFSSIAGIALFVGGIGIMNIMLVGISERTREIGLRKAVGASNGTIMLQFIIESLIISILGGAMGYVLGYFIAFIISMFIPYDPLLSWQIAAVATVSSIAVGLLFGLYPAIRAARKDPIESLRRYH